MPQIENIQIIEVSPLRFLRACNDVELKEVWLLLQSKEFGSRIVLEDQEYVKQLQLVCNEVENQ